MGEDRDKDLEERTGGLSKSVLGFLERQKYAISVPLTLGALWFSYLIFVEGKRLDTEKVHNLVSDWKNWAMIPVYIGLCAVGAVAITASFLAIENHKRKKRGEKPINIALLLKKSFYTKGIPKGESGFKEVLEYSPLQSAIHRGLGDLYFKEGRIIEAMEAYYKSISERDKEWFSRLPVVSSHHDFYAREKLPALEKKLEEDPSNNQVLLELSMKHFALRDFDSAIKYFEMVDKEQDPIAFSILETRLFSEIEKQTSKRSYKAFHVFSRKKSVRKNHSKRAEAAALEAVDRIFNVGDLNGFFEPIGDYTVYRIPLNSFVNGFVVAKEGEKKDLEKEEQNERLFSQVAADGKLRSVQPIRIVEYMGKHYLIQFYEQGDFLAESTNHEHFEDALRFAARSDALMPFDYVKDKVLNPRASFDGRVHNSELPKHIKWAITENSEFLFKHTYSGVFPAVFDGDWRADANCIVGKDGSITALDKEDKGVTIGPVAVARLIYQGTSAEVAKSDDFLNYAVKKCYIPVFQDLSGKKIGEPELFLPVVLTSAIEKSITAYLFTADKPFQQDSAQIFLRNALHTGSRIRNDDRIKKYFSQKEIRQCAYLEEIIVDRLLRSVRAS